MGTIVTIVVADKQNCPKLFDSLDGAFYATCIDAEALKSRLTVELLAARALKLSFIAQTECVTLPGEKYAGMK
jgi:hypothetical protein